MRQNLRAGERSAVECCSCPLSLERRDGLFASGASPVLVGNAWSQLVVGFGAAFMVPRLVFGRERVGRGEGSIGRGVSLAVRWAVDL